MSTAKLRSEPGKTSKATALLDAGRSAKVIAKKDGWAKVRLDSGRTGWVRGDLLSIAKHGERDTQHEAAASPRKARHDGAENDAPRSHKKNVIVASAKPKAAKPKPAAKPIPKIRVAKAEPKPVVKHVAVKPHQVAVMPQKVHPTPAPVKVAIAAAAPVEVKSDDVETTSSSESTPTPTPSATPTPVDRSSSRGERLVRTALAYRGTPYRMGATGRGAFDCSGFTMYLFGKEGTSLPRTAAEQYNKGEAIAKSDLRAGDLVFFKNTYKSGVSHVGIYIGNGDFVHASGVGRGVRTDNLSGQFYINHWAGARRPR